jgi:hypothetical protein
VRPANTTTTTRRGSLLLCVATAALALSAGATACSSSTSGAPVLDGCTALHDASCPVSSSGGGGGGGGGDSGQTVEDAGDQGDAGSCGSAGSLLNASNPECLTCLSTSCCMAATDCTGQCQSLLSCAVAGGFASCESTYSQGVVTDYLDLAGCLGSSCTPQCPTLPTTTTGDL